MVLEKMAACSRLLISYTPPGCERPSVCVFKLSVCIEGKKRRVQVFKNVHPMDVCCLLAASRHGVFMGVSNNKPGA
jgi:hypothetical protein